MAIEIVGTGQQGAATNGNDVTLTFDGSPAEDDVVFVFGGHGTDVSTLSAPTPATYTEIATHTGSAPIFGAWYKRLGATPDSNVVCSGGGDPQDGVAYCCWVLRGVNTSTVLDVSATTAGPTTSTNPDGPSITPVTSGSWVLSMSGSAVNDANPGTLSGYSNLVDNNGNDTNDLTAGGGTFAWSSGAEDPPAWSAWSSGTWYSITVAVRAEPPSPFTYIVPDNVKRQLNHVLRRM